MADILLFTPRHQLDATRNIGDFIELARARLKTVSENLHFEDNIWTYVGGTREHQLRFCTSSSAKPGARHERMEPLHEPFLSFCKAYIRYLQAHEPVKTPETFRLPTLRRVHDCLHEITGTYDISALTPIVLDRTVSVLKSSYATSSLSSYGYELQRLNEFVQANQLVYTSFTWRNPIKHDASYNRVGEEFESRRNERLPSPTALAALAHVFSHTRDPGEIVASSVGALLCAAPARIGEVLHLEAHPEHSERASDGSVQFGLRWRPKKGGEPQVKWVPSVMEHIAKDALKRVRNLTEKARVVAKWYEKNPGSAYLPEHIEYLREKKLLTMSELGMVLWGGDADTGRAMAAIQWLKSHAERSDAIETIKQGKLAMVPFEAVERKLIQLLPPTFPYIDQYSGVKFSEALFVTMRNSFQPGYSEFQCIIEPIQQGFVSGRFGGKPDISMFLAHGLYEEDGNPIHLLSHQCRHYLNMAGQRNNVSQLDIAKWSGRKKVAQNRAYDHVSGRDLAARAQEIMSRETLAQVPAILATPEFLVLRSEVGLPGNGAAHTTEYGHCVHDYSMLPCLRFRDCLNCDEHICVKGDAVREVALRQHLDETRELLKRAKEAIAEEQYGADEWVKHHSKLAHRLEQLLHIIDTPWVPLGAVIRPVTTRENSRIEQASRRRAAALNGNASLDRVEAKASSAPRLPGIDREVA